MALRSSLATLAASIALLTACHVAVKPGGSEPSWAALPIAEFEGVKVVEKVVEKVVFEERESGSSEAAAAYKSRHGTESRYGLVVGVGAYASWPPLANAANDARLMARTLESLGFQVDLRIDPDRKALLEALRQFRQRPPGGAALFYYAGHGVQVDGENYMIPVGAAIGNEDDIEVEGVDVRRAMAAMKGAQARVGIAILDACRNNPLPRGTRSGAQGLAFVRSDGSLVAYATKAGQTAADGAGVNSPYTKALSEALQLPGLRVEQTFKLVRQKVMDTTSGRQVPVEATALEGDFYFSP